MALEFLNPPQGEDRTAAPDVVVEPVAEPVPQAEATVQPEAPVTQPEPTDGPQRGADGKFVAKVEDAPQPQPTLQPEPAPEPVLQAPQVPPGYVPVAALQELRKEVQALRQPPAPPSPAPDPFEDFDAYQAHQEAERHVERLNWSQRLAVVQHGEELTGKVMEWAKGRADQDPMFNQRALQNPDPVGFAVTEYQREQALDLMSKPEALQAFIAWQTQQAQPQPAPQTQALVASVAPIAPAPPAPPRSIVTATSAGGPAAVVTGPGQAFDGLFRKG